jgi:hypothetical protein
MSTKIIVDLNFDLDVAVEVTTHPDVFWIVNLWLASANSPIELGRGRGTQTVTGSIPKGTLQYPNQYWWVSVNCQNMADVSREVDADVSCFQNRKPCGGKENDMNTLAAKAGFEYKMQFKNIF